MDFLSIYHCYKKPTKENIEKILFELAHQELVQKPRYIVNCWTPILSMLKVHAAFQTRQSLTDLYESKRPTSRKIIKLLEAETQSECQKQSLDHLKRYINDIYSFQKVLYTIVSIIGKRLDFVFQKMKLFFIKFYFTIRHNNCFQLQLRVLDLHNLFHRIQH